MFSRINKKNNEQNILHFNNLKDLLDYSMTENKIFKITIKTNLLFDNEKLKNLKLIYCDNSFSFGLNYLKIGNFKFFENGLIQIILTHNIEKSIDDVEFFIYDIIQRKEGEQEKNFKLNIHDIDLFILNSK